MLADEKDLAPYFKEDPSLQQALAGASAALNRTLRDEREDWERIKRERSEKEQQEQRHDRSQGFSM